MRCLVLFVLAGLLAWPQSVAAQTGEQAPAKAALAIHAKYRLAPQLMLRASYYYYVDIFDPIAWAPNWDWCHEPFDCPDSDAKLAHSWFAESVERTRDRIHLGLPPSSRG